MTRIIWCALLAAGALVAPIAGGAQAPGTQGPQPKIREIATIPGVDATDAVRMRNGRVILYGMYENGTGAIFAYDLASKRSTLVTRGYDGEMSLSRAGDRIAYDHRSEDGKIDLIWSIPINPTTGTATGPAQRVSMREGVESSFSPDGTLIAFGAHEDRTGPQTYRHLLAVVPATGGPERVLAEYDDIATTSWSPDGKWIFVLPGRDMQSIERVPAAGGPSERVISTSGRLEGLIDGTIAFHWPSALARFAGRLAYTTTSGAHGEFSIPVGSTPGNYTEFSPVSLLTRTTRPSAARVLSLADGKVRDLLSGNTQSRWPVWSPDGRRIALQDSTGGEYRITVMNADGSQARRYPVGPLDAYSGFMQWSRDGRMLAYYPAGGESSVAVLDLETGATRTVSSSMNGSIPFIWRPDGNSIVVLKWSVSADGRNRRRALYEARLDGTERLLRDTGVEANARAFISDQLMIVGADSEQSVIPTGGGPARKLPGGASLRYLRPGVSPGPSSGARWILWLVQNGDQPITSVDLMTAEGGSLRTLNLPFEVDRQTFHDSFRPDAEHVILVGKTPGESLSKIFLVPINGGAPRVLTQFSGRLSERFDVSPDGKSLVYSLEDAPTTTVYELDVTPIVQVLGKR